MKHKKKFPKLIAVYWFEEDTEKFPTAFELPKINEMGSVLDHSQPVAIYRLEKIQKFNKSNSLID